ncbi:MAG TPA: IclR family transcriptional regulator [Bryobacteraceae bacterium]|nr:IclR family transcriptional regulator [Bryobacteraceae bacterium]
MFNLLHTWITPTNSLERALLLLDLVEKTPGGMRNAEISRQLNIPRSSCSWILARLERQGYLLRDEDSGRYRIGLKMIALAHGALRDLGFRSCAEPVLYRVASETGLAAGIGVLESDHVLLVDRVEPPAWNAIQERPRDERDIGRELPAHSTGLGKVLLAHLPRRELISCLNERILTRRTPKTIVSRDRLIVELRKIRQRGYAIADEEHDIGLRALSAPISDVSGTVRAALSLNGPVSAPIWRDLRALIALVIAAAKDISGNARFPWSGFRWPEKRGEHA